MRRRGRVRVRRRRASAGQPGCRAVRRPPSSSKRPGSPSGAGNPVRIATAPHELDDGAQTRDLSLPRSGIRAILASRLPHPPGVVVRIACGPTGGGSSTWIGAGHRCVYHPRRHESPPDHHVVRRTDNPDRPNLRTRRKMQSAAERARRARLRGSLRRRRRVRPPCPRLVRRRRRPLRHPVPRHHRSGARRRDGARPDRRRDRWNSRPGSSFSRRTWSSTSRRCRRR